LNRQASLPTLASTVCREHELVIQSGESMLLHAVQAGEALLQARAQVEKGGWGSWLRANFPASDRTAKQYMRIARGREQVLGSGVETLSEAEQLVPALSQGLHRQRTNVHEEEAEARKMRGQGATFAAIADHFGIAFQTAQAWVIPGHRSRRNRKLREERRLAREARERKGSRTALKKAGAALAEMYANCERLQDVLAKAREEVSTGEARSSLAAAEEHYRQMRDEVVRALGAENAQSPPAKSEAA